MGLFLDKLNNLETVDKIIIAFVFVVGVIFFPIFCFGAETETVNVNIVDNLAFTNSGSTFSSSSNYNVGYFEVEPGYTYYIENSSDNIRLIAGSNDIPAVGGDYTYLGSIEGHTVYSFNGSSFAYIYFDIRQSNSYITVTREKMLGMSETIDNLSFYTSTDNIWNIFGFAIPYIAVVVLAVIGIYFIRKLISKLSKGKSGVI